MSRITRRLISRAGKGISKTFKSKGFKKFRQIGGTALKVGSRLAAGATLGKAALAGGAALGVGALVAKGVGALRKRFGRDSGVKRRKGVVPKTVKKYVSKMSRRRKAEEKVIKTLVKSTGLMPKAKKSSQGIITQQEALKALRN